ncbi:MAG TPA: serine/threonine-protein kinase [Kofleriaceae bacterium]|nr:serine/threonine-protein kinase [Kofleriaceae bacterium]
MSEQSSDTEIEDRTEAPATKREGPSGSERIRPRPDRLARGATVGRYVIMDELGSGGMGVVYRAFDPELDRKVAIKLLQADATGESIGGQAWLQREAQAMARLSHPNVIAVYDVGSLPPDRVFVAMELVDGVTLRAWLKEEARTWREVVPLLRAAGAGLAAAHATGLVHRDFKPDNILVGRDLRVRVMDFGLARLQTDIDPPSGETPDSQIEAKSPLAKHLTEVGSLVGTPGYMAPELRAGHAADIRTDQFAFGVALYEALFKVRPYPKNAPKGTKPKPPPTDAKVPASVVRVVMRAISIDPNERFASMDALLAELAIDPGARTRRVVTAGIAVAALGGIGAGGYVLYHARPEVCTGLDSRLAGVWDAPTKLRIKSAFDATKRPYAGKSFDALAHDLDAYSHEWVTTAVDSCQATRVRGEQTEEALSLRTVCLDRRLDELRSLAQVLIHADGELVEKADQLGAGLEPLHRCSDVAALRAPGLPPTEPKDVVSHAEQLLADAKAQLLAGHYLECVNAGTEAGHLADELHYAPWKAEALVVAGAAWAGANNVEKADEVCTAAVWKGLEGRSDGLTAEAALCAAATEAQHQAGQAKIWIQLARTIGGRNGNDPETELRALEVGGLVEASSGDVTASIATQQKALAFAERLAGDNVTELWRDEEVIGTTYARIGAWDQALPHLERALALHEAHVGPDHPDIATILTTLGAAYSKAARPDQARAAYIRALAIRERAEGPNSPALALTLNNAADGMIRGGDTAGALVYLDRAKVIAEKSLGDANPLTQAVATTRAEALAAEGRLADSRAQYDAVLAIEAKLQSPLYGATLTSRMTTELGARQWTAAADFAQRAIAVIEVGEGRDAPDLWQPLAGLARADVELGRRADARPLLERSIAIAQKAQIGAGELDPVKKLLADVAKP